ncbi:hypothetical protein [Frigoribacterium sp. CG_9.8]|uniref:hypothetical protein n=1 Tax=Frigoribacterium sp. CG_9.8 TaxID=2787733 RepID=UPI0018C8FD10|nr:hypothetical protein [Frigoribacterium sp. CG_9.8]MBG6106631.1 hypothetical protein [Frigoribacterium sp. CG_9.8]
MAKVGIITYPSSGPIGRLTDLFATFAGSINQALPVKFVPTLAALNAISLNADSLPAGTLAVLIADDSGLSAGAQFTMHPDGKWRLIGTCTAINVTTFITALSTYTKIKTLAGATCWNAVTSSMVVFTSTAGAYAAITSVKMASGSGVTASSIAPGQTLAIPITYVSSTFTQVPSNVIATADNSRPTLAANSRTKDGFNLWIANWSGGALAAGVTYTWTAFA